MALNATISPSPIKFGEFSLDVAAYELRTADQPLRLCRIPMELLLLLIEQRGQLVTREQIVERIWGKGVFLDTDNSINAAIRKIRQTLDDDAEQPRYIQTVIGRGYRFIAEIEEANAQSPASAAASPSTEEEPVPAVRRRTRTAVWSWAGLLLAFAMFLGTGVGENHQPLFGGAVAHRRPCVAVLGFENLSGKQEKAWMSSALSEMLGADLAAGQQLRLIPGEDVARMKVDLLLAPAGGYSAETLAKIRYRLNSELIVIGSYLATGDGTAGKIRVNLKVQDTDSGEIIAAISEDGTEADLPELVTRGSNRLRQLLHIGGTSSGDADQGRSLWQPDL